MIDGAAIAIFMDLWVSWPASAFQPADMESIDFNKFANGEGKGGGMALSQSGETTLAGLRGHP